MIAVVAVLVLVDLKFQGQLDLCGRASAECKDGGENGVVCDGYLVTFQGSGPCSKHHPEFRSPYSP